MPQPSLGLILANRAVVLGKVTVRDLRWGVHETGSSPELLMPVSFVATPGLRRTGRPCIRTGALTRARAADTLSSGGGRAR